MIGKDLNYAIQLLNAEAVVAIPTETVYGLAGNALSPRAVSTIFEVKNRPSFDPLIVHTSHLERISALATEMPEAARQLARRFMPGPLTLLLPRSGLIPDIVTAGSPRVAVRIPAHPLTQELLAALDFPLAAPSANPFGYISPTTARHVEDQLGDKIPYILDGGPCRVGLESTIVGFEDGQVVVYRKGGIAVEDIEAVAGPVLVRPHSSSNPAAPGMLKSHYAPSAPVVLGDIRRLLLRYPGKKAGTIAFRAPIPGIPEERQLVLSPAGDLAEAARNLFAGMRRLDAQGLDVILAELLPEQGLGRAINDRLRRAAAA
ncbi:MAG: threonylcarbamoyl-AMP synthase [Phaeodactylibacter sp.]|nr:threonylcarbamoyl-AMP synthase [Phaeodactylibacter sp.]MCB9294362.1 threonylcarbamoyl-AMP synthase [Lewinellaceae bacterium]